MEIITLLENQLSKQLLKETPLIVDYDNQMLNYNIIKDNHNVGFIINYNLKNNCVCCYTQIYLKNIITNNNILSIILNDNLTDDKIKCFVNKVILEINTMIDYFNNNIYKKKTIVYNRYVNFSVEEINDGYVSKVKSVYL